MDESEKNLEALREETQPQGRLADDPSNDKSTDSSPTEQGGDDSERDDTGPMETRQERLATSIETKLAEIEQEDRQKVVSAWDGEAVALLTVLEEQPEEMEQVDEKLREHLGVAQSDTTDRSDLVRLLLRVGLQEATPELMAALEDAMRRRVSQTV